MSRKTFTIKQASEIAKCSPMTIRRAINEAHLPAYKPGKCILILEKDFNAWFNSKLVVPTMDPRLITNPHPQVRSKLNGFKGL